MQAARAYLNNQQPIDVAMEGGRTLQARIVSFASDVILVWDETRDLLESRRQTNIHDHGPPNTEVILNWPLRGFVSIPDGCWRPWDLHPNALKEHQVLCVVQMLLASFVRRKRVGMRSRITGGSGYTFDDAMSTEKSSLLLIASGTISDTGPKSTPSSTRGGATE